MSSVEEPRKWGLGLGCHLRPEPNNHISSLLGLRLGFGYPSDSARVQPHQPASSKTPLG
jgi:hypothetical protein